MGTGTIISLVEHVAPECVVQASEVPRRSILHVCMSFIAQDEELRIVALLPPLRFTYPVQSVYVQSDDSGDRELYAKLEASKPL